MSKEVGAGGRFDIFLDSGLSIHKKKFLRPLSDIFSYIQTEKEK